jgi:hypothetical protein
MHSERIVFCHITSTLELSQETQQGVLGSSARTSLTTFDLLLQRSVGFRTVTSVRPFVIHNDSVDDEPRWRLGR